MDKIKVLVIDDHEMVRKGLMAFLQTEPDIDVIGEASNGTEGVRLAVELEPDVILMDLVMEGMDGIAATSEIMEHAKSTNKPVRVIALTSYVDDDKVFPVMEAGAFSYLLKTTRATDLVEAIRKARRGESIIEGKVAGKLIQRFQRADQAKHASLTQRELEILALLGEGMTNMEIGETLHIGIKTVKTHVSNILAKLEVKDRTQAAIYANKHDLTSK